MLLIDGIEMNERAYATTQFGQHYPLSHIQRIEIMRGAGSAIYGGNSKLGGINIITKSAEDLDGVHVVGNYGSMSKTAGEENLSLLAGKVTDDKLNIRLLATKGVGQRSDRIYTDAFGKKLDMSSTEDTNPQMINFNIQYNSLNFKVLLDDNHTDSRDRLTNIRNSIKKNDFKSENYDLHYQENLTPSLKLSANFNFSKQSPWKAWDYGLQVFAQRVSSNRYLRVSICSIRSVSI